MSVYYDVYLHHQFLSFHLGERKKMKKSHEKKRRERETERMWKEKKKMRKKEPKDSTSFFL